jgi:hypothetical protein
VLARVLDHLQADFLVRAHFSYGRMIDLEGLDLLDKISGVPADVDHITSAQHTGLEPDDRDCQVAVIVSHDADAFSLFRWRRVRARRRSHCFGLCRCADWRRSNRNLRARFGFLGCTRKGAFLVGFFLIVLVFLTVVAFLRVAALLPCVFLRLALPLAFFLVATAIFLDAHWI